MPREGTFRDAVAWQKGMRLVNAVYQATADWPTQEQFGLVSQTRRAAVSIPSNIAEGHGRIGKAELKHHLSIAHGSLSELETLLLVAGENGLIDSDEHERFLAQADEVGKLIRGFIRSLGHREPPAMCVGVKQTDVLLDSSTGNGKEPI